MTVRLDNPILHAEVDISVNSGPADTYFAHVPFAVAEKWSKQDVGAVGGEHLVFDYLKIGEGGWVYASGGQRVKREPEPSLSDLDCIEHPDRYPGAASERYSFTKAVHTISYVPDRIAQAAGTVLTTEANDDGSGNPDFWEVALFDTSDNMVVYATIQKLTKDVTKTIEITFRIYR